MIWHVIPEDDIKEHLLKSTCSCEPEVIPVNESGDMIITHNRFDGGDVDDFVNEIVRSYE